MIPPAIQINNLTKRFPNSAEAALKGINVELSRGQIVGLIGPDGAGKTTLIRLMAGLLEPTEGTVLLEGVDASKNEKNLHEIIGYMPQQFGLYEDLTVAENMRLYADLQGVALEERDQTFDKLLKFSGLHPFVKRLAGKLSGGMKQKLGLVCTLMRTPKILLLDEPSVGVDPYSRRQLWKMVEEIAGEGLTIIWSTSYLDEADRCRHVILLNKGELLFSGVPLEVQESMVGKTFLLKNLGDNRRSVLEKMVLSPKILDGTVQSDALRIVLREKDVKPSLEEIDCPQAQWEETTPRFEDGVIERLGGITNKKSILADNYRNIESDHATMIYAERLTKRFGDFTAVDGISFGVKKGEIFGLLGPNGAGKSTTFRLLCGLLRPSDGDCSVGGLSLQKASGEARAKIGYMSQKFSLYGSMSVYQNLRFFSGIYGIPNDKRFEEVDKMISIFEMESYKETPSKDIPLGFQRRLALACAVMHEPLVLFLDEPTSGVDPLMRREFWSHISALVEKGVTVLVTTHFMDEAEYCDRIALINGGKLLTIGTPDDLKRQAHTAENPNPSLEDAFIYLSRERDH